MSSEDKIDSSRRNLVFATAAVGGVATVATAVPFVRSMSPSERALSAGAPVEADISKLKPGEMMTVAWRGKPVWIVYRDKEMLDSLKTTDSLVSDPHSEDSTQPSYAKNEYRSLKPEYLVLVGICTHLGCSPTAEFQTGAASGVSSNWPGGWLCPCHGSMFDMAGRVFKDKPAPLNLVVPPYRFASATTIIIGEDSKRA